MFVVWKKYVVWPNEWLNKKALREVQMQFYYKHATLKPGIAWIIVSQRRMDSCVPWEITKPCTSLSAWQITDNNKYLQKQNH